MLRRGTGLTCCIAFANRLYLFVEGWGNAEEWASKVPAVLLTGGTLTADLWLDERTVYYLWAGSITGPGLAHLPSVHLLGENVTVRDTLES